MAPRKETAAYFNLADLNQYSHGGGIPEGNYIWKDLTIQMYQATKQSGAAVGPARLGCMITMVGLDLSSGSPVLGEERTQFYSFGSNAHQSWAPNSETGKSIVAIPCGPGASPNDQTNWAFLVKSLQDCGLPNGVWDGDVSALEGMWVHMANVPEPEERKGFKQNMTGEAGDQPQGPKTIAIVSQILDEGKPWEGTGGIPEVQTAAPKGKAKVNGSAGNAVPKQPAARTTQAESSAPSATNTSHSEDDDSMIALTAISEVLGVHPDGCPRILLKTSAFKSITTAHDQATANRITNAVFANEKELGALLLSVGYTLKGPSVVVAG